MKEIKKMKKVEVVKEIKNNVNFKTLFFDLNSMSLKELKDDLLKIRENKVFRVFEKYKNLQDEILFRKFQVEEPKLKFVSKKVKFPETNFYSFPNKEILFRKFNLKVTRLKRRKEEIFSFLTLTGAKAYFSSNGDNINLYFIKEGVVTMKKLKVSEFKKVISVLNETDLIPKRLEVDDDNVEESIKKFLEYVELVPEDNEDELPDVVIDAYNVLAHEGAKLIDDPKNQPKKKEPKKIKEVSIKGKSRYGHKLGSQAGKIDDLLWEGGTMEELVTKTGLAKGRIKSHIYHLRNNRDVNIIETNGALKADKEKL